MKLARNILLIKSRLKHNGVDIDGKKEEENINHITKTCNHYSQLLIFIALTLIISAHYRLVATYLDSLEFV